MKRNTISIGSLHLTNLTRQYYTHDLSPRQVIEEILDRITARGDDGIWTYVCSREQLMKRAAELEAIAPEQRANYPLWGIPFSVKDCIDVATLPTSCACPGFVYRATQTNPAVQQILDAGAILVGKTNLDQFATGLVGIRTGYTVPQNPFIPEYIPGGSSSGAALSVATGLVSFAIGTDTGGSGRVPAGFNNIVGLKPTRGTLSTAHMVDACKTLDCVSIFALTAGDAWTVLQVAKGHDLQAPFSRPDMPPPRHLAEYRSGQPFRFGVPDLANREFFGNANVKSLYEEAIATLTKMGGLAVEIDYTPFVEINTLLFNGPWVAERYVSVGAFVEAHPDQVHPVTRDILLKAKELTAAETFQGLYQLEVLKRQIQPIWKQIDILVVPTTGTTYTITEIEADPLRLNANLGYYTNFVNLLDLVAIALPNGFQTNGMPTGVTLISVPHTEAYLVELGGLFRRQRVSQLGATPFPLP
jgi:allophanate hydrolase